MPCRSLACEAGYFTRAKKPGFCLALQALNPHNQNVDRSEHLCYNRFIITQPKILPDPTGEDNHMPEVDTLTPSDNYPIPTA